MTITSKQVKTAVYISIIVGTILTLINQGEAFFDEGDLNWFKVITTYIVPFCVSMYSSIMATRGTTKNVKLVEVTSTTKVNKVKIPH
ncbi:MAG: nitrate/nitrite transporter NrtS [Paraglaciecola sp.]|uniref:nitrate/nitrite transporter NrtS n=1 Tax=Paraglaciecola sp. TaxID=1920173 RepID=UPI003263465C